MLVSIADDKAHSTQYLRLQPGKWKVVDKEIPKIQDQSDAIVKLVRTTICGTDLHILKGDVPTCDKGRTLGHEGIGVITEAGSELKNFKKGDRVVIRCITCCGSCSFCKRRLGELVINIDKTYADDV